MLVFCDLETNGLHTNDRQNGHIYEAAFVATTENLSPFAEFTIVINPAAGANPYEIDTFDFLEEGAAEMHLKSGLLHEVETRGVSYDTAQRELVTWLMQTIGMPPGEVPLCGSTIDFDRDFLRRRLPAAESPFHYRSINVSTVKELAVRWCPLSARWQSSPDKAHRALADIHESLRELTHYKREIFDRVPATHAAL